VDPSLAQTAVVLAARHGSSALFDALLARLKRAETPELRLVALAGLTGFDDPALIERTLDLTLDSTIKQQDLRYVFRPLFERRQSRDVTYAWLVRHFDELAKRLPGFILGRLVGVAAGLCDDTRIDEAEAFFRPRLEHLEGADKHLTQALELGRQCARFRAAQQTGAAGAP
jgi:aminopeptidase N/puromycin-sensitive aminopeptidase